MEEIKKREMPPDLSFEPVKKGGTNFTARRLKTLPDGTLVFCPTLLNWFVSSIFILFTIPFLFPFFTLRISSLQKVEFNSSPTECGQDLASHF